MIIRGGFRIAGQVGAKIILAVCFMLTACAADGLLPNEQEQAGNANEQVESLSSKETEMKPSAENPIVEPVENITFDGNSIVASVTSTGCTTSEHFEVKSVVQDSVCEVTLLRNKPDYCRRAPFSVEVSVPWEPEANCAIDTLVFANPVFDGDSGKAKREITRQLQQP